MTAGQDQTEYVARLEARNRDLEAALKQNDKPLAATFKLSNQMGNLLGLMLTLPHVSPEMIRQRLDVSSDAKVAKHRLQKALLGWEIKIHTRRGLGYWLKDEDKARIKGLLEAAKALAVAVDPPAPEAEAPPLDPQIDLEEAIAATEPEALAA